MNSTIFAVKFLVLLDVIITVVIPPVNSSCHVRPSVLTSVQQN